MASEKQQIIGTVRSQDLSVSWISEPGINRNDTDRVCILMMANGQVRLTMQSATLNLKGMRLTKGHICVFALFEAFDHESTEVADRASETFMNNMMRYDITKKPAEKVIRKCLSLADKAAAKGSGDKKYGASIAAFAAKEFTGCCVNGGRMFIQQEDGSVMKFTSSSNEFLLLGDIWKNVIMPSKSYPLQDNNIKDDMRCPIGDIVTKRGLKELLDTSSLIRVQRL
ncbi:MAG: hypothetical protein LBV13_03305 [Methanomassiliicoccaceae archaeon]|jgi:hypothetical protein|nr:hypothetical protein [Methanomassiliicoccaceae archaeon]